MWKLASGCGVGIVLATTLLAGTAAATVTLTASRTDVLYTTTPEDEIDCGAFARAMDADLPYNVVRIRAEDDTGQATSFRWKLPKPNVGYLLRDDPTIDGSAGGAFAVQAFCADVGSGCILTKESLDTYRLPTILYAGPTCDDGLPSNTSRQFSGDTVRIRVKADGQRGRAAKGTVDVGYGRLGSPILWASNESLEPANGIGRDEIPTFLDPTFSVTLEAGIVPPAPIKEYFFDNGDGDTDSPTSCLLDGAAPDSPACTRLEYETAGRFKPHVEVRLMDDSAYCDNATVRVGTCRPKTTLDVDRSPRKRTYSSDDGTPEEVTITLRNQASRSDGCPFILEELTCTTRVKLRDFDEMERVAFQPAQCAENGAIFCSNDLDCGSAGPCLDRSHCSQTTERLCTADAECQPRQCAECEEDETCIRVIPVQRTVFPGESAVFLQEQVDLRSVLKGAAVVTETWSVKERFDRGNASTTDRFKIRGPKIR